MQTIVKLSLPETIRAYDGAHMRCYHNWVSDSKTRFGQSDDEIAIWRAHVDGCIGELAVSKLYGLPWDGTSPDKDAPDVGSHFEVRATRHQTGRLIIHPPPSQWVRGDKPECPYFLVRLHDFPNCEIVGWLYAHEAQAQPDWWQNPTGKPNRTAYFVPNGRLHEIQYEDDSTRPVWIDLDTSFTARKRAEVSDRAVLRPA